MPIEARVERGREKRNPETTPVDGYLGSREDEERSETRYVMRIAGTSEPSNLRTHLALPAPPGARPSERRPKTRRPPHPSSREGRGAALGPSPPRLRAERRRPKSRRPKPLGARPRIPFPRRPEGSLRSPRSLRPPPAKGGERKARQSRRERAQAPPPALADNMVSLSPFGRRAEESASKGPYKTPGRRDGEAGDKSLQPFFQKTDLGSDVITRRT